MTLNTIHLFMARVSFQWNNKNYQKYLSISQNRLLVQLWISWSAVSIFRSDWKHLWVCSFTKNLKLVQTSTPVLNSNALHVRDHHWFWEVSKPKEGKSIFLFWC